ncbi:hypothetical protein ACOSP7_005925 [Xanthoceras sorbifolium]
MLTKALQVRYPRKKLRLPSLIFRGSRNIKRHKNSIHVLLKKKKKAASSSGFFNLQILSQNYIIQILCIQVKTIDLLGGWGIYTGNHCLVKLMVTCLLLSCKYFSKLQPTHQAKENFNKNKQEKKLCSSVHMFASKI